MDFESLRTFIAVVEEKNFTKAGERRLLSQPSISLQMKNLEADLKTKLVDRSPKHLRVTPSGELLYRRAKQMLELYEKTKEEIFALHHRVTGTLRIGASYTIGEYILPKLLTEFHSHYPDIHLEARINNTGRVAEAVRLYQLDIGLIEGSVDATDLDIHPFMEDDMLVVTPLGKGNVDHDLGTNAIQDEIWLAREKGSGTREFMDHFFHKHGIRVKNLITISSNQGIKEAILNGLGLSILSRWVIEKDAEQGLLTILPLREKLTRIFSYVLPGNIEQSKAVQVFLETIHKRNGR
ncbi:LysR family transcriptional regulator [Camelliibacillus cellulosilyticus]|uniref:LysR family transcriptional regulator n=1 Tax=Camelliibacillus cellulosilyticus TaxID=2174486 RepID=A0ABV9GKW8_9BACL